METKITLPNVGQGNVVLFGVKSGKIKKWVYVQSSTTSLINGVVSFIKTKEGDTIIELTKFLELLTKANRNALEILYAPDDYILYCHSFFNSILNNKKIFLTKECAYTFSADAIIQLRKTKLLAKRLSQQDKKMDSKSFLDFCYVIDEDLQPISGVSSRFASVHLQDYFNPLQIEGMGAAALPYTKNLFNLYWDAKYTKTFKSLTLDENNDLIESDIPKDSNNIGMLYYDKEGYQAYLTEFEEYQIWVKEQEEKKDTIDLSGLLNGIHGLSMGKDIAYRQTFFTRSNTEGFFNHLKNDKNSMHRIISYVEKSLNDFDILYKHTILPSKFRNHSYVNFLNLQIRNKIDAQLKTKEKNYY